MKYKHIFAFEEYEPEAQVQNETPDKSAASATPASTPTSEPKKNPFDEKTLAQKLRLYAQASEVPVKVTALGKKDSYYCFDIFTHIPSDKREFGTKMFHVEVGEFDVAKSRVVTYEGDKEHGYKSVQQTDIEIEGENDISVILWDYIEATQLYDDNVTEDLVDACKNVHTVEDIQKIAKTLVPKKTLYDT